MKSSLSRLGLIASSLPALLSTACGPSTSTIDKDSDGVADSVGWAVDEDRDGVPDQLDINYDGQPDGVGVDTDADYKADALGIDTNGDGIIDDVVRSEAEFLAWLNGGTGGAPGAGGAPDSGQVGSGGVTPGAGGAQVGSGGGVGSGIGGPSGGSPGFGTGGAGPTASLGCGSADILCADFEDTPAGQKPSGTPWLTETCFDQGYKKTVQAGVGIDGSQGFVTSGTSASANSCALVYDLGTLSDFWVRAFVKIGGTNPDMQHEVTFLELAASATTDDPELRLGYRGDNSCSNAGAAYQGFELGATRGLNNGEDTGCTGSKTNNGIPVANEWYCLEVHVTQGSNQLMSDLYVNGVNQDFLIHSSPKTEVGGAFVAQYLKVGMQSYSGAFDSLTIDDVSLSTTRIPCA